MLVWPVHVVLLMGSRLVGGRGIALMVIGILRGKRRVAMRQLCESVVGEVLSV